MSSRYRTKKRLPLVLFALVGIAVAALFYFGLPSNYGVVNKSAGTHAQTAVASTSNTAGAAADNSVATMTPATVPESQNSVTIDGNIIYVDVATTTAEIDQGLQYRQTLAENQGMLFLFDHSAKFRFWMPNMNFSLDMIWIGSNMQVVDITKDAPPLPDPSNPVWFSPSVPAQYVLEVNAGYADSHDIKPGDAVTFSLSNS